MNYHKSFFGFNVVGRGGTLLRNHISSILSKAKSTTCSTLIEIQRQDYNLYLFPQLTGSSNKYGKKGTIPIPTVVGPHRFITGLVLRANLRPANLTAE